ncbi:hypothetical protein [Promicromonospora sp. NFX87]|uniref:hypothetical protein n=1 Tax=Promicromonospora sp. NFX87 TaxID=3402691 RepID=UPI003AFA2318
MPTLHDDRALWIARICSETLTPLGDRYRHLADMVRDDLGPTTVVAAFLSARVAEWVAQSGDLVDVADRVVATHVLRPEYAGRGEVEEFVDAVESAVSNRGFGGTDRWDLFTHARTLAELWCTLGDGRWSTDDLRRLLVRRWNIVDRQGVEYLLGLGRDPLLGLRTLPEKMGDLLDDLPRAMIAQCFVNDEVQRRRETAMSAQHFVGVEHLRRLAVDLHTLGPTMTILRNTVEDASYPVAARRAAADAHEFVRAHHQAIGAAMQDLTIHECDRLTTDPEIHFRRACLDAFAARDRHIGEIATFRSYHGTFGDLPWWQIAADDDAVGELSELLATGAAEFLFSLEEEKFEVSLAVGPVGSETAYEFVFELWHMVSACELLHLGHTRSVGIDVDVQRGDAVERLGSTWLTIPAELAEQILDLATMTLRAHTGQEAEGYTDYLEVYGAVEATLLEPRNRTWSRAGGQRWAGVPRFGY